MQRTPTYQTRLHQITTCEGITEVNCTLALNTLVENLGLAKLGFNLIIATSWHRGVQLDCDLKNNMFWLRISSFAC